jgi:ectoine hydroxylase
MSLRASARQHAGPPSAAEREQFDRDGFLVIRSALTLDEAGFYRDALDRVYAAAEEDRRIQSGGPLHQLSAVANCPEAAGLLDHPATFPYVWSVLGWNIHVYHSHLDVHPPLTACRPFWFGWHQDGGRQNREIEADPRPRLSVKLAYWLSDVSEPGRGNLKVVPGSHLTNWIPGPARRDVEWPDPDGAIEVTANPGDAVLFDRRLWHARSDNHSPHTPQGDVLRLHLPVDRAPRPESSDLARRPGRPTQPHPAAASRRPAGHRRRPRLGPRPRGHPAARLAEKAQPARSGQPAAQAVTSLAPCTAATPPNPVLAGSRA